MKFVQFNVRKEYKSCNSYFITFRELWLILEPYTCTVRWYNLGVPRPCLSNFSGNVERTIVSVWQCSQMSIYFYCFQLRKRSQLSSSKHPLNQLTLPCKVQTVVSILHYHTCCGKSRCELCKMRDFDSGSWQPLGSSSLAITLTFFSKAWKLISSELEAHPLHDVNSAQKVLNVAMFCSECMWKASHTWNPTNHRIITNRSILAIIILILLYMHVTHLEMVTEYLAFQAHDFPHTFNTEH